jgi:multidrug efflux pump subunit AcrB
MTENNNEPKGVIASIVKPFLSGTPAIILIVISICLGIGAIMVTAREEDPQIVVPLADIFVDVPGTPVEEVEKLVATPLEKLLFQIDGVEYVYSMSRNGMAIVTVRFYVGEDREDSLVKLHNKIMMNIDLVPPIVQNWIIKPVEIDDVPIVNMTLYSDSYHDDELRRIGEEVIWRLSKLPDDSRTNIIGGRSREIRVELIPKRMAGVNITLLQVKNALQAADISLIAGQVDRQNRHVTIAGNSHLKSVDEVNNLVVGVYKDRPVYLRDLAHVTDGPAEVTHYTRFGHSIRFRQEMVGTKNFSSIPADKPMRYSAVTLAVAKKRGTNATKVAESIIAEMRTLEATIIPDGVHVEITRDYGRTAQEKVNDLLVSLGFAIVTVVALLFFTLGWREALVVAIAVPVSFCLALFVNYLFGYTINRVTLFALILSLGLVVDDPITNVDNIQRHIFMGQRNPFDATLFAVNEVLPPVIMSTLAIIVSFAPLFFITGMMGPYMAPMSANVPFTVSFSTLCALTIVPWMTYLLLKNHRSVGKKPNFSQEGNVPGWLFRIYEKLMAPFLRSRIARYLLLIVILLLLAFSVSLIFFRQVPLKMLPFDNKNEFQLVIDMPEGTTLETTDAAVRLFEDYLREVSEVTHLVSYVGTHSPIDFNGMVRRYYLREEPHHADIRVNLAHKSHRVQQSHEIALRLRNDLMAIAEKTGASIKIVEVPPGPPVMATIVVELYGTPDKTYNQLMRAADSVQEIMKAEPFVVDIDDSTEAYRERIAFLLDREKAALHGISAQQIIQTLKIAVDGETPAAVHEPSERHPLKVNMILPRADRSSIADLSQLPIAGHSGKTVPLAELCDIIHVPEEQTIYHKNLEKVVYVMAEMAGRAPAEAIFDMKNRLEDQPLSQGIRANWVGEGEWKITVEVFRDMGIAFGVAMIGIYIILILQTNSFLMPIMIMMSIPLTLIGIMPGFWLLNAIVGKNIGGYDNLVFFTATSMIGMIALGGIVIRNSLVLIEFIQDSLQKNIPVKEAIVQSGAVRMRPILLTAATTGLGAWPITLDPIFSGLAWALIFGLFASTLFTLLVIPVTYYAVYGKRIER